VDVPVLNEVRAADEALPTVGAAEGPLLCVHSLMQKEIRAGPEPLLTLRTFVGPFPGPFPGVKTLVDHQVRALAEALPTFPTCVGSFPSVDLLVADQVGPPAEALPTFPTCVGSFPSVDLLVADQVGPPAEALPTFQA
ncbi:hypothetical protein N305_01351, partial [Manacus vitellinus]